MQNSRQAYVNLALATAAFAVAFAAWSMISPLSHQIQADFNLDNTSIGLLIALPTLLGALMRVPMERFLQLAGHVVELVGQSFDLVAGLDRDALPEIAASRRPGPSR
jgi:cyanate permease